MSSLYMLHLRQWPVINFVVYALPSALLLKVDGEVRSQTSQSKCGEETVL